MKRLLDLLLSSLALLVLLPFGLVIMALLALTAEGEVFYLQERVGKGGRPFKLFKFATMVKSATGSVTLPDDPRVLPVGRFLRKTKLNELPQLLNILKGDLSVVGPRPLTGEMFGLYEPRVQETIARVKPGLTGLGSIVFRDEESILAASPLPAMECHRREIAPYKGALEVWYVEHRSLWLDLKLIALTAVAVVAPGSRLHERALPGIPRREEVLAASAP